MKNFSNTNKIKRFSLLTHCHVIDLNRCHIDSVLLFFIISSEASYLFSIIIVIIFIAHSFDIISHLTDKHCTNKRKSIQLLYDFNIYNFLLYTFNRKQITFVIQIVG